MRTIENVLDLVREYKDTEDVDALETAIEMLTGISASRAYQLNQVIKHLEAARGALLGAYSVATPVEAFLLEPELRVVADLTTRVKRLGSVI